MHRPSRLRCAHPLPFGHLLNRACVQQQHGVHHLFLLLAVLHVEEGAFELVLVDLRLLVLGADVHEAQERLFFLFLLALGFSGSGVTGVDLEEVLAHAVLLLEVLVHNVSGGGRMDAAGFGYRRRFFLFHVFLSFVNEIVETHGDHFKVLYVEQHIQLIPYTLLDPYEQEIVIDFIYCNHCLSSSLLEALGVLPVYSCSACLRGP